VDISKKVLPLLIKIILVLIIPYYLVTFSTRTTSESSIIGTWGHWPEELFTSPFTDSFWESYQLIIALLFIAPLVVFSFVYQHKQVDRKCIGSALVAISISCIATYIFIPQYSFLNVRMSIYNVVPNVVSLSLFVFVFWPLLQNSWPSTSVMKDEEEQVIVKRLRNIIARTVPLNAATVVWIALLTLPATLIVSNLFVTESQVTSIFILVGGLLSIQHDYWYIMVSGINPTIWSYFYLIIARWSTVSDLLVLILNLSIGITAFRFIQGEATKKRVYILIILSFLVYAISFVIMMGRMTIGIPLPIFQIFMLFVMKYAQVPISDSSGDTIRVPFSVRLASKLRGGKSSHESKEAKDDVDEQKHIDEL